MNDIINKMTTEIDSFNKKVEQALNRKVTGIGLLDRFIKKKTDTKINKDTLYNALIFLYDMDSFRLRIYGNNQVLYNMNNTDRKLYKDFMQNNDLVLGFVGPVSNKLDLSGLLYYIPEHLAQDCMLPDFLDEIKLQSTIKYNKEKHRYNTILDAIIDNGYPLFYNKLDLPFVEWFSEDQTSRRNQDNIAMIDDYIKITLEKLHLLDSIITDGQNPDNLPKTDAKIQETVQRCISMYKKGTQLLTIMREEKRKRDLDVAI